MKRNILILGLVITLILVQFYIYCGQTLYPSQWINYASKIRFTCMIVVHIFGMVMFLRFIYVADSLRYAYCSLILCIFNSICISSTEIWIQMKVGGVRIDNSYKNRPIQFSLVNIYFLIYMYSLIGLVFSSIFILLNQILAYFQRRRRRIAFELNVVNVRYDEWMNEINCAICLTQYSKNNTIVKMNCKHIFHQQCVSTWINLNKNCPLCRASILPKYQQ